MQLLKMWVSDDYCEEIIITKARVCQFESTVPGRYILAISSINVDEKEFHEGQIVKVTIEPIKEDIIK